MKILHYLYILQYRRKVLKRINRIVAASKRSERAAQYSQRKKIHHLLLDSFSGTLCLTRVSDRFGL